MISRYGSEQYRVESGKMLPVRFGSGRTAGILQSAAALFAAGICGYLGFLQAHNGKEGPEDELD